MRWWLNSFSRSSSILWCVLTMGVRSGMKGWWKNNRGVVRSETNAEAWRSLNNREHTLGPGACFSQIYALWCSAPLTHKCHRKETKETTQRQLVHHQHILASALQDETVCVCVGGGVMARCAGSLCSCRSYPNTLTKPLSSQCKFRPFLNPCWTEQQMGCTRWQVRDWHWHICRVKRGFYGQQSCPWASQAVGCYVTPTPISHHLPTGADLERRAACCWRERKRQHQMLTKQSEVLVQANLIGRKKKKKILQALLSGSVDSHWGWVKETPHLHPPCPSLFHKHTLLQHQWQTSSACIHHTPFSAMSRQATPTGVPIITERIHTSRGGWIQNICCLLPVHFWMLIIKKKRKKNLPCALCYIWAAGVKQTGLSYVCMKKNLPDLIIQVKYRSNLSLVNMRSINQRIT